MAQAISEPEGFIAISRWLSAAIPPEKIHLFAPHPEGMPARFTEDNDVHIPELHYHAAFSTKCREPAIDLAWQGRLHEFLGGTIRGLGGFPEIAGVVADHVHLLFGLKATHCLADFMRELKKASSAWVHDEIHAKFFWQEGYAAFTVSPNARESVRNYIANQAERHRKKTYREELAEFLQRAGVQYDPRYLD